MTNAQPATPEDKKRPFGLTSATALVLANMIGAGVFTTSGFALADLGDRSYVLLAWIVGGLIACCGAVSYGGLARHISESGGEYLFLGKLLHPAFGFLAGWVSLLAGFTGAIAFAATAFESYAFPRESRPEAWIDGTLGIAAVIGFGALHSLVLHEGVVTQNVVVGLKVLLLAVVLAFAGLSSTTTGWPGMDVADAATPFSLFAFASSLVWISLSYSGFNAAVYVSSEVRDPRRTVPRALWLGTVIVTVLYLALNTAFLYAPTPDAIRGQEAVAAIAADAIGGTPLALLVRVILCLALLSSVSSMVIAGSRVYARMAADGALPRFFRARDGDDGRPPTAAIWLQVILSTIVILVTTLEDLLGYLGMTLLLSSAASVACLFVVARRTRGLERPPFGYPWAPAIYVLATLVSATLSAIHNPWQLAGAVVTLATGSIAWLVLRPPRAARD